MGREIDLTYRYYGSRVSFIPHSSAGEDAWRILEDERMETVSFLRFPYVLAELKNAGYNVRKAREKKSATRWTKTDDKLLKELQS